MQIFHVHKWNCLRRRSDSQALIYKNLYQKDMDFPHEMRPPSSQKAATEEDQEIFQNSSGQVDEMG